VSWSGELRPATGADLEALAELERETFESDRFSLRQIDYLLRRAHATVIVAEEEGRLIGAAYMLWRKGAAFGRLYSIAVHPSSRGSGVAAKLLGECELESRRRGLSRVTLEVRADNETAIKFYQRYGYSTLASLHDYYEDGMTALKMVKMLAGTS
jgi:ribosomal protein S18 acetylase RimI-like enzyme